MGRSVRTRAEAALQLLNQGSRDYNDSADDHGQDNDLETEGLEWQWIYADDAQQSSDEHASQEVVEQPTIGDTRKRKATGALLAPASRKILGARRGDYAVYIGEAVFLKAERNEDFVAIFVDVVEEDVDDEKTAVFQWFVTKSEIRSKGRRDDALENELYLTTATDENVLDSINGKPEILSWQRFLSRYPTGKVPRKHQGKVFMCRRGCTTRTATYTSEFVWEDVYRSFDDLASMNARIETETKVTRKRRAENKNKHKGEGDEYAMDTAGDDVEPQTPRKRRKLDSDVTKTPRSAAKGSSKTTPRKFTTPTHKRIITKKPLEFTPLGTRILSPSQLSSPFQLARSQLHVSSVPASLPCREEEFATVYSYLESAITDGTGSCIYISGTPGTGKTATVREVVAQLNASVAAEELDDFIFVEINGMKVTDPHQSYSLLWEAITGDRLSPTHALSLLEKEFSSPSPRRVPCVVLMDELDQLVTKNQSVMYNFFNWPNLRHSRLIVLAVANTMDLPERTLSNKISSRLGLTRITFTGYTHEQLIKIIQSRLEGVPGTVVDPDAIQFASRKVAQVSGDARRALDICRRAVEIAESDAAALASKDDGELVAPDTPSKKGRDGRDARKALHEIDSPNTSPLKVSGKLTVKPAAVVKVTISTVQRAIREATSSPLQQVLRHLPLSSKVFLAAISARVRRTGVAECVMGEVMDEAKKLSSMSELLPIHDFLLCDSAAAAAIAAANTEHHHQAGTVRTRAKPSSKPAARVPRVLSLGSAAMELVEAGIVMLESRRGERHGKVRLNIGDEEIKLALKDDEQVRGLGFS